MYNVTVYSKTDCIQCKFAKKTLDEFGVWYEEVNLDEFPGLIDNLKSHGISSLPVIVENDNYDDAIIGFDYEALCERFS